jgi:hypothetical protein
MLSKHIKKEVFSFYLSNDRDVCGISLHIGRICFCFFFSFLADEYNMHRIINLALLTDLFVKW